MSVRILVLFFARAKELAGKDRSFLEVPSSLTSLDLLQLLVKEYDLQEIKNNILLSVNEETYALDEKLNLNEGDEIAVIPPISGEEITNLVTASSCGAISIFVGTTRDNFDGKTVLNLEYEAYESMGIKSMERICSEIRRKWEHVENIAIYHRLGQVPVKEASIIIAVSSPHREDAIKATEWCIDSVKKSVPIWKKEVYADAQAAWKENKESKTHPPKRKKIKLEIHQKVNTPFVPSHLVQIKASKEDIENRISKFMERKRAEIDSRNITEFYPSSRDPECAGCARTESLMYKRKDSKSHLEVKRVLNSYQSRDQKSSHYLIKYIPSNGIEERLQNVECQLSLGRPTSRNVYKRLQMVEDRLMVLESISPEYIQFWEKANLATKSVKKKVFSLEEIDDLIAEVERKGTPKSVP